MTVSRTHRPTLKDVARAADVSVSTASRALSGSDRISQATRDLVAQAAAEIGYRPNIQARALRMSRSTTIAVVVPSLVNHYFAAMVTAIQEHAATRGITTIVAATNESAEEHSKALDALTDQRVAGIICVPHEDCAAQIRALAAGGTPVVLVDRTLPDPAPPTSDTAEDAASASRPGPQATPAIPTVTSDPRPGMTAALELLADAGSLPVGYLSGPMSTSTGRERLEVFTSAAAGLGLDTSHVFRGGYEQELGRRGAEELIDQGVAALFAGDSMMTVGVIEACHRRDLEIGVDIAVIGFDNQPLFDLQPRPITVIDQDVRRMALTALQILADLVNGAPGDATTETDHTGRPAHIRVPTRLITRRSVPGTN